LRWQGFCISAWLTVALLAMGLPPVVAPVAREWAALTSGVPEELIGAAERILRQPTPAWLTVYALATQAVSVWFTYFSRSSKVKDHDKFVVFLVICVAALFWLPTIGQWMGSWVCAGWKARKKEEQSRPAKEGG
jgi:hypothetical protein